MYQRGNGFIRSAQVHDLAEQQYYVYLYCWMITASHQPYVKNYGPNFIEDIGNVAAALWLDR